MTPGVSLLTYVYPRVLLSCHMTQKSVRTRYLVTRPLKTPILDVTLEYFLLLLRLKEEERFSSIQ